MERPLAGIFWADRYSCKAGHCTDRPADWATIQIWTRWSRVMRSHHSFVVLALSPSSEASLRPHLACMQDLHSTPLLQL